MPALTRAVRRLCAAPLLLAVALAPTAQQAALAKAAPRPLEAGAAVAARWSGRIDYVAGAAHATLGLAAVLVRPDGIVAWAAEGEPDSAPLERAVARWFGEA